VGHRGRDRIVVRYTTTCAISVTTKAVSSNSIQDYVIKCVSDLQQVGGFLRILQFPAPIKLIATI
jgi:hypothetical protein